VTGWYVVWKRLIDFACSARIMYPQSDEYNVPLWMGESGENNVWWYRDAVQLLESNNIGWAWWTWKKMARTEFSDVSGPGAFSIVKPDGYQMLIDYWANSSSNPKPEESFAFDVMMEVANNALLKNSVRNDAVFDALTGHVLRPCEGETELLDTSEPVRIEAEEYCEVFGFLTDPASDAGGGANVGFTDAGDLLTYKVSVPLARTYTVVYRYASLEGGGGLQLESEEGTDLGSVDFFPATGGWQVWESLSDAVDLPSGTYKLIVRATGGGWNLNWLEFSIQAM